MNTIDLDTKAKKTGGLFVPVQVMESLVKVIAYSYDDELEHYEENATTIEDKVEHIFPHLTRVNKWVQMLIDSNTHTTNK